MQTLEYPSFDSITEPRMVCFGIGNGSGSKLFQSYLDGHPQIYMVPAYILMYLYPHWEQWVSDYKDNWNWKTIVDVFCQKHASLLDTRRIPGHDGMTTLGDTQNQWLEIDENLFKTVLMNLLCDQTITCKTFLLAIHYAYAYVRNENLSDKTILVYHIHVHEYVPKYLLPDFPDMLAVGFVRDPRSNLKGRYESVVYIDKHKLNNTDAVIYKRRTYYYHSIWFTESLEYLKGINLDCVRVVRHEDMHHRLEDLMQSTVRFLGVDYHDCLLKSTFGGLLWWGDKAYNMKPMNEPNPRVISSDWQNTLPTLDWFVLEALFYNYCIKYGYSLYKYRRDNIFNRLIACLLMLLPSYYEKLIFVDYINVFNLWSHIKHAYHESVEYKTLKDYTTNAYYRHKWSNKGLKLSTVRWYRRLMEFCSTYYDSKAKSFLAYVVLLTGRGCYLLVNVFRYLFSIILFPIIVLNRSQLFLKAFKRMITKRAYLPDIL
tara:strand:+ start:1795 stop:3249 length:1455 start_codon:yes stop_codon:yes gene_type:complete